jgi:hypothetical protein
MKGYWQELLDKVKAGATLYISLDDAYLPTFTGPLGIDISVNIKRRNNLSFVSKLLGDSLNFTTTAARKYVIDPKQNAVLAKEEDGNPVFMKSTYGKGFIYLLTFPIESNLTNLTGAFDKGQPAYANIYKEIAKPFSKDRLLTQNNPYIGVTEHELSGSEKVVVLINYGTEDINIIPLLKSGWKIAKSFYGNYVSEKSLTVKANDALVLSVQSK